MHTGGIEMERSYCHQAGQITLSALWGLSLAGVEDCVVQRTAVPRLPVWKVRKVCDFGHLLNAEARNLDAETTLGVSAKEIRGLALPRHVFVRNYLTSIPCEQFPDFGLAHCRLWIVCQEPLPVTQVLGIECPEPIAMPIGQFLIYPK
jgi:hypothetical protein